jgi:hypothetical protein
VGDWVLWATRCRVESATGLSGLFTIGYREEG